MMIEMVLCGRGGQGIVFLTRQIGAIAVARGLHVISSETHGMAVRGGSINSHLRIGPFSSSLIRQGSADFLVSLDASETGNNVHFLKTDGVIIENSLEKGNGGIRRVDASGLARDLGRVQMENVVMIGFASTCPGFPVSSDDLRDHLGRETREEVRVANLKALEAGILAGVGG